MLGVMVLFTFFLRFTREKKSTECDGRKAKWCIVYSSEN